MYRGQGHPYRNQSHRRSMQEHLPGRYRIFFHVEQYVRKLLAQSLRLFLRQQHRQFALGIPGKLHQELLAQSGQVFFLCAGPEVRLQHIAHIGQQVLGLFFQQVGLGLRRRAFFAQLLLQGKGHLAQLLVYVLEAALHRGNGVRITQVGAQGAQGNKQSIGPKQGEADGVYQAAVCAGGQEPGFVEHPRYGQKEQGAKIFKDKAQVIHQQIANVGGGGLRFPHILHALGNVLPRNAFPGAVFLVGFLFFHRHFAAVNIHQHIGRYLLQHAGHRAHHKSAHHYPNGNIADRGLARYAIESHQRRQEVRQAGHKPGNHAQALFAQPAQHGIEQGSQPRDDVVDDHHQVGGSSGAHTQIVVDNGPHGLA